MKENAIKVKPREVLERRGREKIDEYLSSVREVEKKLVASEAWVNKPKPKVDQKPPAGINDGNDLIGRTRLLFDLIPLALQTFAQPATRPR